MSITQQNLKYPKCIYNTVDTNPISNPILTADFNSIQTTIQGGDNLSMGAVVGTFQAGEIVSGGTSGATALIAYVLSPYANLLVIDISGTFQVGETITGSISGATADFNSLAILSYEFIPYGSNNAITVAPDVTALQTQQNDYFPVSYTDENGVLYTPAGGYYEFTSDVIKTFNIETYGMAWYIPTLKVKSGDLSVHYVDVNLFNFH